MTDQDEHRLWEKTRWGGRADEYAAWKCWWSVLGMMAAGEWMMLALTGRRENGLERRRLFDLEERWERPNERS